MSILSPKRSSFSILNSIFFILILLSSLFPSSLLAERKPHKIPFRFPNLYPESFAWDPQAQHFLLGSLNQRIIAAVTDAAVAETFISDTSLPENATFLGLAVDSVNQRLLAVVHAMEPLPPFDALAAYDLRSRQRLFLSTLPADDAAHGGGAIRPIANDVAVDYKGNAYVTNAAGNYIWKVNDKGEASIFSRSALYTAYPVVRDTLYSFCGLNGIAYVSKGYLLVVQSNTGKMFKVDVNDGTARVVVLNEDLMGADDIAFGDDGVVLVVSPVNKLWYLKSEDSWGQGGVYDEIDLDLERFPTGVVVGGRKRNRAYVLYGHVMEGMMGNSSGREIFSIEEVRSKKGEDDHIWIFVLIGMGLAYFFVWRFQMRHLVKKINKVK